MQNQSKRKLRLVRRVFPCPVSLVPYKCVEVSIDRCVSSFVIDLDCFHETSIYFFKINQVAQFFNLTKPLIFFRTTGLYTKTLAKIILHDVTRSMAVFVVVFLSFCGALSLSLRYSSENQHFRCVLISP